MYSELCGSTKDFFSETIAFHIYKLEYLIDGKSGWIEDNVERQEVDATDSVMGVQFARDLGFSSVMLEMDSKALVQINDDEDRYETTS
ncbi:hypothetical protein ACFX1X_022796 [Malus domestica]